MRLGGVHSVGMAKRHARRCGCQKNTPRICRDVFPPRAGKSPPVHAIWVRGVRRATGAQPRTAGDAAGGEGEGGEVPDARPSLPTFAVRTHEAVAGGGGERSRHNAAAARLQRAQPPPPHPLPSGSQ